MEALQKVLYLLLKKHMPLDSVEKLASEAHELDGYFVSEIELAIVNDLARYAIGDPFKTKGRVLKRATCIKALETIRDWESGADEDAEKQTGIEEIDTSAYANWILKHG